VKGRRKHPEPPPADVQALLERRAARLRQVPPAEDLEPRVPVAEFALGAARYAIPLARLRATVPLRAVTPVPLAPPHVIGVLRFQGQIISALSLASLLGVRGWQKDPAVLLVTEVGPGRLVAFDCEDVPRPTAVRERDLEEARARAGGAVLAVTAADELRPLNVLEVANLVPGPDGG
jgi:purine-binding chemotaxis protein CheW